MQNNTTLSLRTYHLSAQGVRVSRCPGQLHPDLKALQGAYNTLAEFL